MLNFFSVSSRLAAESVGNISGGHLRPNPAMAPTVDPDLRAGRTVSVGLGANFIEPAAPVYQNLDGTQVERDWMAQAVLRRAF